MYLDSYSYLLCHIKVAGSLCVFLMVTNKANIFPLKKTNLFLSDVYKHLVWFVLEARLNLINGS